MSAVCPTSTDWLRLLDGEVTRNEEPRLRAHLAGCAACQKTVAELKQLAGDLAAPLPRVAAEGSVDSVMQAIAEGRAAQLAAAPRKPTFAVWGGALGLAAAATLTLFLFRGDGVRPGPEFGARGGAATDELARRVGIALYAPFAKHTRLHDGSQVGARTAFTAAYRNVEDKRAVYLLSFGVDSRGEIHWLYPAYTQPNSDPEAIRLPFSANETALAESVVLEQPALGKLRLFSIVTTEPVRVSAIESAGAAALTPAALERRLPHSHVETLDVVLVAGQAGVEGVTH